MLSASELIDLYERLVSCSECTKDVVLNDKCHVSIDNIQNVRMISLVLSSKHGLERDIMRLIITNGERTVDKSSITNETFMYIPESSEVNITHNYDPVGTVTFSHTTTDTIDEVEFQSNTISTHGSIITLMSYLYSIKSKYLVYSSNYTLDCMRESYEALKVYNENNK